MTKYEIDLEEIIKENNSSEEPLPCDAMNVVINEFNAHMLAKIALSLETIAECLKKSTK